MQKDYHAIERADADLPETEHIARHWTAVWDRLRADGWTPRVIRSDEKYRLMRPYLQRLDRGARVLDGGCGLGQWVLALDEDGFRTTGLDLSRQTIAFLDGRFPGHAFVAGDIRSIPAPEDSFDAYLSWGTFEHFEQGMEAPIREAHRVLKPGGLLFITVPFQNLRHRLRGIPRGVDGAAKRFYQWRFTRDELRQELEMRGFRALDIVPISKAEGAGRTVEHDLRLRRRSPLGRIITKALLVTAPRSLLCHMLFAVARKS